MILTPYQIAKVAHEANREYCRQIGDPVAAPFDQSEPDLQASTIAGVERLLADPATTPEASHEGWRAARTAQGWTFSHILDREQKTHPCLVPYAELPLAQRRKDHLFRAIVLALTGDA